MRASKHTCLKSQVLHSKEAAMRTVGSQFGGLWIVAALLCSATAIDAQRTSFRSQSDWEAWTIPSGVAEVSRLGERLGNQAQRIVEKRTR